MEKKPLLEKSDPPKILIPSKILSDPESTYEYTQSTEGGKDFPPTYMKGVLEKLEHIHVVPSEKSITTDPKTRWEYVWRNAQNKQIIFQLHMDGDRKTLERTHIDLISQGQFFGHISCADFAKLYNLAPDTRPQQVLNTVIEDLQFWFDFQHIQEEFKKEIQNTLQ